MDNNEAADQYLDEHREGSWINVQLFKRHNTSVLVMR